MFVSGRPKKVGGIIENTGFVFRKSLSVYTYTYIVMATKTISITEEAYNALIHQKKGNESFTQAILRITKTTGKLTDSFGKWKMTDQEEQTIQGELSEGWRMTQERLSVEMPRY